MIAARFSAIFVLALGSAALAQEPEFNPRPALPFPTGISLESQCGIVDDLQHVEFYDGTLGVTKDFVDTHEVTTVQLQWLAEAEIRLALPDHVPGNVAGARWCTATLIDNATLLTAGHCFDINRGETGWISPFRFDANGQPVFAEPDVLATLLVANFGYQLSGEDGQIRTPDVFPISALTEHRLGGLDYAVVELGTNADGEMPANLGHLPGAVDIRAVEDDEELTIIQHPQGDPKKIEAGGARQSFGSNLFYDNIDTHGGSSGSGVRDADGEVVAVHTNGGCTPSGSGANRGVLMKAIADYSAVF